MLNLIINIILSYQWKRLLGAIAKPKMASSVGSYIDESKCKFYYELVGVGPNE